MALLSSGISRPTSPCRACLSRNAWNLSWVTTKCSALRSAFGPIFSPSRRSTWKTYDQMTVRRKISHDKSKAIHTFHLNGLISSIPSFMSSFQLYLVTTVFNLNMIPLSWHHLQPIDTQLERILGQMVKMYSATWNTFRVCTPLPFSLRPTLKFVSSSNESQLTPMISRYLPYLSNQSNVTLDPLQMMPVDSSFNSSLQYLIMSPMKWGRRNGSPPEIFIFTIPASARSLRPHLASSSGRVSDDVSVWKQNSQARDRRWITAWLKNAS